MDVENRRGTDFNVSGSTTAIPPCAGRPSAPGGASGTAVAATALAGAVALEQFGPEPAAELGLVLG